MTYTERSWRTCAFTLVPAWVTVTRCDSTASARGRMMSVQMLWMMMTESSRALMLYTASSRTQCGRSRRFSAVVFSRLSGAFSVAMQVFSFQERGQKVYSLVGGVTD